MAVSTDSHSAATTPTSTTRKHLKLINTAVSTVLTDRGFGVASDEAIRAQLCAERMLKWISEHEDVADSFATNLIKSVQSCCEHNAVVTCRTMKERMWEKYFKLCSSDGFRSLWTDFLMSSIGFHSCSIFSQFVTDFIMETIIKDQFPVELANCENSVASLDFEESNALRYTAGYILQSLSKKVARSANPLKDDLLLCLAEICEDKYENEEHESENWVKTIDRGGLIYVSDVVYMLFVSMEMELRKHLTTANATCGSSIKDIALQQIMQNEDVLFYWSITSVNWDTAESNELLKLIVDHWITVRGFSFASGFMENFKKSIKKSTQKSKGLRKKLDNV